MEDRLSTFEYRSYNNARLAKPSNIYHIFGIHFAISRVKKSKKKQKMQTINLDLDHSNFFCPITGIQILSDEDFKPTPAVKFFYSDSGYLHYLSPELKDILKTLGYDEYDEDLEFDGDDFEKLVDNFKDKSTWVMFAITETGIACGPVWSTVYIGIDMNQKPGSQN